MFIASFFSIQTTSYTPEKRRIAGICEEWSDIDNKYVPAKRLVVVINMNNELYMESTVTNKSDGLFEFKGLPEIPGNKIEVHIHDPSGVYQSMSYDRIAMVE